MPEEKEFKDSGERRAFGDSGAVRDKATGKGRFDLIPEIAMVLLARVYEAGAAKYAARNWEKGIPVSVFIDSAQRHLSKYKTGLRDEPHLSMALWNVVGALWTAAMVRFGLRPAELYDLPNHTSSMVDAVSEPLSESEVASLVTYGLSDPRVKPVR